MTRGLISFFLAISVLFSNLSLMYHREFKKFDEDKVLENIYYLSSNTMGGRLPGSLGNRLAGEYIKNTLINYNLSPLNKSYYDDFQADTPIKIEGNPILNVYDLDKRLVKSYEYGVDFKDSFLNFRTNHIYVDSSSEFKIYPGALEVIKDKKSFTFIVSKDNLNFRSSFISNAKTEMSIFISSKLYNDLITYNKKGYTIDCFIPYKIENTQLYNIVGMIRGTNPKLPPLIISSHYDHLGKDLLGNIYNGSLDNASGTSFMLELARMLSSMIPPERNIIFVSFNAEEFGLLGSKAFVTDNIGLISGGRSINFDMIGGSKDVPLTIMSSKNLNRSLLTYDMESYCKKHNIDFNVEAKDSSDHVSFIEAGIDSVTLSDSDTSKIHTTNDKAQYIDLYSIKRDYSVAWNNIINYGYNSHLLLIYNENVMLIGYLFSLFLVIILFVVGAPSKSRQVK